MELLARIAQLEVQRGFAKEDYRAFCQQLSFDGQQLAKALRILEGRVNQAAVKQQVVDTMHEIKLEINQVEQEVIRACHVLKQRLKRFEIVRAWTNENLTIKFAKWQAMHRELVWQVFEE